MPLLDCEPSPLELQFTAKLEDEEVVTLNLANHDDGMSPGVCPTGWNGNVVWSLKPGSRLAGKKYTITPESGVLTKDAFAHVQIKCHTGQTALASDSFTLSMERSVLARAPEASEDWRLPITSPVKVVLKAAAKKKSVVQKKAKAKGDVAKQKTHVKADTGEAARLEQKRLLEESTPCLYYFAHAGRGELTRLIASVGGLQIDGESDIEDKASFASAGSLPCLTHGHLRLSQSFAIEGYVGRIAPNFFCLTAAQRATDDMFCRVKEELLQGFAAILMGMKDDKDKKATAADDIAAIGDRWFPIIENMLPADGFINGMPVPTAADLALLNILMAFMPFGAAYKIGAYDPRQLHREFTTHVDRVAEHPAVQAYLLKSITMQSDPFGFRASVVVQEEPDEDTYGRRASLCNDIDDDDLRERMEQMESMGDDFEEPQKTDRSAATELSIKQEAIKVEVRPSANTMWPFMFGSCCRRDDAADRSDVSDAQALIAQVND